MVEIGSDVIFGDETVTGWFAEHDVAVALVRPDSMVFGAVHDAVQVAQLSRTLRAYFNQGPHS